MDSASSSLSSSPYTTFIIRVDTQTPGWEKSMIKVLKGIPGATFSIDANGLARVTGNIDPGKTLKLLSKAGKHAQLCSIDSGTNHHHHHQHQHSEMVDPLSRYWQANHHQYYNHHHQQPYPLPPPQYLPYSSVPPEQYYATESTQCIIM